MISFCAVLDTQLHLLEEKEEKFCMTLDSDAWLNISIAGWHMQYNSKLQTSQYQVVAG